jgi:SNF2 family DNA or RNA helicase
MGLIEPYTYQISSSEATKLPSKLFHEHTCWLTSEQENCYQYEKEMLLEIIKRDEVSATDIFQVFTRMQQIVSGYYIDNKGNRNVLETNKLLMIDNIPLEEKTIFFCKYIFEVQQIIEKLGKENCSVFTGKNIKDRDDQLDLFVTGDKKFFVATMQSGGTGLNGLQIASNRIVFVSNSFSYFQRKQSIGRIDRQGQTREMHIHDLLTYSGIDDRIMRNLRRKGNLADEIKVLLKDKTKLKKYIQKL